MNSLKFLIYITPYFISLNFVIAQNTIPSNSSDLEVICKAWGLIKYYHPDVQTGSYDLDNLLLRSFEDIDNFYWQKPKGIDNEKHLQKYKVKGAIYGMFGFIINAKAMKLFIKYALPLSYPSDCILGRLNQSGLIKSYSLKKEHQLIKYFNMGTTIGNR